MTQSFLPPIHGTLERSKTHLLTVYRFPQDDTKAEHIRRRPVRIVKHQLRSHVGILRTKNLFASGFLSAHSESTGPLPLPFVRDAGPASGVRGADSNEHGIENGIGAATLIAIRKRGTAFTLTDSRAGCIRHAFHLSSSLCLL